MNRLKSEKSPYLLQHAGNPVDWYPWGPEAFGKARREDKPIFLSIGYSTCHWCHVMAHESFEDGETAKLLNDRFVSIKVDREERPDLDSLYMSACHILTGSGGWPLSIFMTPDGKPYYAGTYFPKEGRFGRIGMKNLLQRLSDYWINRREEVLKAADGIAALLEEKAPAKGKPAGKPDLRAMERACRELERCFDETHGGFGSAPKFPTAHHFLFLLRHWKRTGNERALQMVEKSLREMRRGGVYDQVGFGFHRYSVDARWFLPHFEKMLYDQALLAMAYTEAFQATEKPEYRKTVREIFTYVLRDLTSPEGGFHSGEDADSEGVEGKFYLWKEEEVRKVLGEKADLWIRIFNVETAGNLKDEGEKGENIFHLRTGWKEQEGLGTVMDDCRSRLFLAREKRVHPHRDDKVLTDWNGLMIAALAKGAQAFDREDYADAARRSADFLLAHLRTPAGRLLHRWREGESAVPAFLDDYAFLMWGLIELYETVFDPSYLEAALSLNDVVLRHFGDPEGDAFFFTADDGEKLLTRKKEFYDGAIPSGNSVMVLNLLRLGRMTGNAFLEERAAQAARSFSALVEEIASAYTQFLTALDFGIGPTREVLIAGPISKEETKSMIRALRRPFLPDKVVLLRPCDDPASPIVRLAPFASGMNCMDGRATAYICLAGSCRKPTTDIGRMMDLLTGKETME